MNNQTAMVRALNDQLRQNLNRGVSLMTCGITALGSDAIARIIRIIAAFDNFCEANDPYGEHDFGTFEAEGKTIFFKIDYYDTTLNYGSMNPADPSVTERVITIMLAEEY